MKVAIDRYEAMHCASVAAHRSVNAHYDGRKLERDSHFIQTGLSKHYVGALGEYAVAKALNRHWCPAIRRLDDGTGDVDQLQVKATTRRDGCLIVDVKDQEQFWFFLAVLSVQPGQIAVTLPGKILGSEAKQKQFFRERNMAQNIHRGGFFVPQSQLIPIEKDFA